MGCAHTSTQSPDRTKLLKVRRMSFPLQDIITTIKQAQQKIGGEGSTFFTDWEVVLTAQEAYLSAVLSGFKLPEIVTLLEKLGNMRKANEALYKAQCEFDQACTSAIRAL